MLPAVEPLSLRLPKDLLVLQPMHGHLDLEPVLLVPGLRCVIGSSASCAVRLSNSDLVEPEHCVIEVIGRQTLLTEWTAEATWLNDRLISEPCELVPRDRVAIGPFDFRVRPASADELLYAKLVERDSADADQVDDLLRLKRAISAPTRTGSSPSSDRQSDLFSNLIRETANDTEASSHERLTQHISKLLNELQGQVLTLQDREADLNDQLRRQREEPHHKHPPTDDASQRKSSHPATRLPASVRSEYEQVLQLLQAERDQLDRERAEFAAEQDHWQAQQREWSRRLEALESQLAELATQRTALAEEKDISRSLAEELLRDEAQLSQWEARLRREEKDLAARRKELDSRDREFFDPSKPSITPIVKMIETQGNSRPESAREGRSNHVTADSVADTTVNRPLQTLLTLISFGASAFFLGSGLGDPEVYSVVGWSTALLGAISTVDLLLHRCFSPRRSGR